ncbi:MAG: hypothetical protein GY781_19935, partial [Gammaproteobacteria bacterium]|nr:hypothetical protein [Gammaproteobacteria bacterium]
MAYSGNNEVKISVSHLVNKYNTNLTNKVGKDYTYLVYGNDVDGVPLVVDKSSTKVEVGTLGADEYYPAFRNVTTSSNSRLLYLDSIYDPADVSYDDVVEFLSKSADYIIEGKNSYVGRLREVLKGGTVPQVVIEVRPWAYKDTTGADAIQFNEVVVIKYTQPSTLNYPYGSEVGNSDIYLENGNPLPF